MRFKPPGSSNKIAAVRAATIWRSFRRVRCDNPPRVDSAVFTDDFNAAFLAQRLRLPARQGGGWNIP